VVIQSKRVQGVERSIWASGVPGMGCAAGVASADGAGGAAGVAGPGEPSLKMSSEC